MAETNINVSADPAEAGDAETARAAVEQAKIAAETLNMQATHHAAMQINDHQEEIAEVANDVEDVADDVEEVSEELDQWAARLEAAIAAQSNVNAQMLEKLAALETIVSSLAQPQISSPMETAVQPENLEPAPEAAEMVAEISVPENPVAVRARKRKHRWM